MRNFKVLVKNEKWEDVEKIMTEQEIEKARKENILVEVITEEVEPLKSLSKHQLLELLEEVNKIIDKEIKVRDTAILREYHQARIDGIKLVVEMLNHYYNLY